MILDSWRWVIQAPKTWAGLQTFNWWPTPKMTDPTAGWPHKLQTRPQWLVASSSLAKGAKHGWSRSWIRDFSAQSAATWGVLRYVSFTFFLKITPGCEGVIQFHAYFFGVWKSPSNLWVFLFLAFFLVVIRSRSFPEGAVEMVQIVLVTPSQRTRQTPLHVVLLELRFKQHHSAFVSERLMNHPKGTRLPSNVVAHAFKYKDAPSEEDISYSTTQCINSSLGQS